MEIAGRQPKKNRHDARRETQEKKAILRYFQKNPEKTRKISEFQTFFTLIL